MHTDAIHSQQSHSHKEFKIMVTRSTPKKDHSVLGNSWVTSDFGESSTRTKVAPKGAHNLGKSEHLEAVASTPSAKEGPSKRSEKPVSATRADVIMPRIHEEEFSVPERQRATRIPDSGRDNRRTRRTSSYQREETKAETGGGNLFLSIGDFAVDVLGTSFRALRTPLGYALAIYLLCGLMVVTRNVLVSRI